MLHNVELLGHTHAIDKSLLPPVAEHFEKVGKAAGYLVNQALSRFKFNGLFFQAEHFTLDSRFRGDDRENVYFSDYAISKATTPAVRPGGLLPQGFASSRATKSMPSEETRMLLV